MLFSFTRILLLFILFVPLPCLGSDAAPEALRPGLRVKVKGELGADGRLLAASVRHKSSADDDLELCGVVERVDPDTRKFRVQGVWIDPRRGDLDRRQRRVAQALLPGDWVALEGEVEGSELVLDELTRPRGGERIASVEGLVSAIQTEIASRRSIAIGPVLVIIAEETEWKGF